MRFLIRSFCVVWVFFVLSSLSALAVTRYVWENSPSPGGGYTTWNTAAHEIQLAIDAASDGDLILVTNGNYTTGGRAVGVITNRIALNKAITVRSINGPTNTFVSGEKNSEWYGTMGPNSVRCAYVGSNAVLDGFTLTNGYTGGYTESGLDQNGGGVLCEINGTLTNCVVKYSRAYNNGGGVYRGTVLNSTIYACDASYYGGGAATCTVIGCRVEKCTSGLRGGGLYQGFALNSLIISNDASYYGGGAYENVSSNCQFVGNFAGYESNHGGGGVNKGHHYNGFFTLNFGYTHGGAAYDSDLHGCIISNNMADNGAGVAYSKLSNCIIKCNTTPYYGGGSYNSQLTDCIIERNVAWLEAAGHSYGWGGGMYEGSALRCIIVSNDVRYNGGGACTAFLTNCIVAHNTATNQDSMGGGIAGCTAVACMISSNRAHYGGGAAYGTLINCTNQWNDAGITNYSTYGGGGGAYMSKLRGCLITKNLAAHNAHGGGMLGGSAEGCRIIGNTSAYDTGSGFRGCGGGAYGSALTNCIVAHNYSEGAGGGICSGSVFHCTIISNTAAAFGRGGGTYAGTAVCSIIYFNYAYNSVFYPDATNTSETLLISCCTTSTLPIPAGNITAKPMFAETTNRYALASNSPCVDYITNSITPYDYSGVPRPLYGNRTNYWDIGANEYVNPTADTDNDTMNDAWEIQYTLNPIVNDAELDKDSDFENNYSEWKAGTDPTNAASFLSMANAATFGSGLAVSWPSVAGRSYQLQRCEALATGAWVAIQSSIAAVPPMNTVTDTTAVGSGPWTYRVKVE
jgi:hypothetical protein